MGNLRTKLKNGGQVMGTMVTTFAHPDIARLLQLSGFDFFLIDCEHGAYSFGEVSRMVDLARAIGIDAIVRVPELRREHILKYMEMGASGLLLPNTESAEEAKKLVEYAKYAPLGQRGVSLSRPHTDYRKVDGKAYMQKANEETMLLCQIESRAGVEHVEDILAVDGIDVAFVGPNDLSQDYGVLGEFDHPDILAAFDRVIRAADAAGKLCGVHFGAPGPLKRWLSEGMRVNMCGSDIGLLQLGAKSVLSELSE